MTLRPVMTMATAWRDDAGWHIGRSGLNLIHVQSGLAAKAKRLSRLDLGREG